MEREEAFIMKGLVVEWTLPSKATLVDWISEVVEDVRVKEVVELFPKEIFVALENIRRVFYYKVEKLTVPAYSLKILPAEALPRFQEAVEETRKALEKLDAQIQDALKSEYTQKAISYYLRKAEAKPRIVESLSKRFQVFMIPLKIDRVLWTEFLDETMRAEMERARGAYMEEKRKLEEELANIRREIDEAGKVLEERRKELAEAEEQVAKAYEGVTLPFDLALLRTQKAELEAKVKDLRAKARDLELKIQRLEREQREREERYSSAAVWARQQTENTERRMRFDAYAVLNQQLRDLIDEGLRVMEEEDASVRKRELKRLEKVSRAALERVRSIMPGSRMASCYEVVYDAFREAVEGNMEEAKSRLERIRREI